MSTVVDRLVRMTLKLSSPDGNLCATVDSERNAKFSFRDETWFEHYDAPLLAVQVEALFRTISTGREEGIRRAYAADGREPAAVDGSRWDATHQRFHEALARMEPLGQSPTGLVILAGTADLSNCHADINARALRGTDAPTFLRELSTAYRNLLNDRRRRRAELVKQHLDH